MSFIIDASFVVSWLFPDEGGPHVERVMDRAIAGGAHVPGHWCVEVANAIVTSRRRGRFGKAFADGIVARYLGLPVTVDDAPPALVFPDVVALGERYALTAYDGAYLELALRLDAPLATLDAALIRAAKAEGVALMGQPA